MSFPISPSNGQITVVNGITYTYNLSEGSWTRSPAPVGNLAITGNLTANKVYTTEGLYWSGNGVAFSSSGADDTLRANVGAYQTYANANAATQATSIDTINANIGSFYSYANANIGSIYNQLNTLDANVGSFESYANIYLSTAATFTVTNAGSGAYVINSESNPTLYLIRGQKYNFSVSASGHPFWIKTAASTGTGDQYNTGVVNNGDDVGLITFDVPLTAPDVLYYICQYHSSMNGKLLVVDFADIDANIGTLFLGNVSTQANIGTLFLGNVDTQANLGTLFLGNAATQANIGTLFLGNAATQANLGTLFLGNVSTQANLGAFQTFSNANVAAQATSINTINANIGAFYNYANTKIGNNSNSNLVVVSTTDSISSTTGALVVAGGAGIAGNLYVAGNIFASNLVSINSTTLTVQDPLLYLAASDPFPYNYDIGFFSHFVGGSLTRYQHSGFARNVNDSTWTLFSNVFAEPGTTIAWSEANIIYDPIKVGSATIANTTISTGTTTGALVVAGGAGIAGALNIANTGDVSANIGTLFLGNVDTQANLGTLFLGNAATQANLGAFYAYANTKIGNNSNSNLVVISTTEATSNVTGALVIRGGVGVSGNVFANTIYTTTGIRWAGNGVAFSSGGGSGTPGGSDTEIQYNSTGSFAGSSGFTFNSTTGNVTIASNLVAGNASILGNTSTNRLYITTGLFWSGNGASISTSGGGGSGTPGGSDTQMQFNDGSTFNGANITFNKSTGNLVISSVTTSTSTTTGALVVGGGVGIAGNVVADKLYTSTGIYWAGNKAPVGAAFTTSSSAPANPAVGSFWYKTTNDILYEYINDGTGSYWVDISTQTIAATTAGEAIASNVTIGGNLLITGTITGSVGYLLERANIVASAPPATTNLDLISASILYFTSNSTANVTANIRGNSTVTLNSMLAVGQSSTFVMFMPNATAYYVNTIKIDNTTVTPFWQGGTTVTNGNANSLDIYTFAVLKTADATFKVFASQVKYQNLGP
jgi:hypothetical protein